MKAFRNKYLGSDMNYKELTQDDFLKVAKIAEIYEESCSWDWVYGNTPEFSRTIETRFDWALLEI